MGCDVEDSAKNVYAFIQIFDRIMRRERKMELNKRKETFQHEKKY